MSFLAGGIANVFGQGAGLSKSFGLLQELTGQPDRVQLIVPSIGTFLQFDACINEQHGRDAQVTTSPIEDGGVVSDHIIVSPVTLSLTGVISDTPLYGGSRFMTQTYGNAATAFLPPLGVVTAASAYTYGTRAAALDNPANETQSPSKAAYNTLMAMAAGDPKANPPVLPSPITVLTAYARYPDMVIKSLSMPRDASTGGQCIFTLQLEQIMRVAPMSVPIAVLKDPQASSGRSNLGEKPTKPSKVALAAGSGITSGADVTNAAINKVSGMTNALGNFGDNAALKLGY